MRLVKARIRGYRSIVDTGYFDVEDRKTILVGPNEAGKTAVLQALQKLNPPPGTALFNPLRDYPRARYDADIKNGAVKADAFTVVEGHFRLEDAEKASIPKEYRELTYIYGRYLNNSPWHRIDGGPGGLAFSAIETDLARVCLHFDEVFGQGNPNADASKLPGASYRTISDKLTPKTIIDLATAKSLQAWLDANLKYLNEDNKKETGRYERLKTALRAPFEYDEVLSTCHRLLPQFVLFSNYFRIKPSLHLRNLATRVESKVMDDDQYDYGNLCLLKFLGFTAKELADAGDTSKINVADPAQLEKYKAQLDTRDYALNAATIRLTDAIVEVWNPKLDKRDVSKLRIKADGQYLKVVVEDELGVEVELDQRSEGFQWMVSFFVVFFAEAADKHKNAILLLDEPGLSLHGLKQAEFRETVTKLSQKNQTIFTTHSPFLVGPKELDSVRVVEMADRKAGTKIHGTLTATDSGAMLPLQEALGYSLAQSLFFHRKNLVLEGLTDYWYLEALSELFIAEGKSGLDDNIALLPAGCASKVVYYATILHAQDLRVAALLDSDAEGDLAAQQDTLVNALGNKRILRTRDVYSGKVKAVEIEDLLRDTLLDIAKSQLGWDAVGKAQSQEGRPIIDLLAEVAKPQVSKYKLAKAFLRWSRDHDLSELREPEIAYAQELIERINKALK